MIDTQEAFIVWLRMTLLGDQSLSNKMDGLYSTWAKKDAPFPYVVYRLDLNNTTPNRVITEGTLYIDIWDYNQLERDTLRIRKDIIRLLDTRLVKAKEIEQYFLRPTQIVEEEQTVISSARINFENDAWVVEDTQNIWHRSMNFSVRMDRMAELRDISNRDQILWDLS